MKEVSVGFLWHMHQPYYKDPIAQTYLLPWVRLHSIRAYYDMISLLEFYPDVTCTFNLVPSLLAQIIDYTDNGLRDTDYYLSEKRPSDLTGEERKLIISRFFMGNLQTLIAPFPRYLNLMEKRGQSTKPGDLDSVVKKFSDQDILDLQVLFNLTWTGFTARKDANVRDLIKKGRSYSESDKMFLLEYHMEIMKKIIPLYKKAHSSGQIEITTSPFYHPIGPLIMNVGYALRSMDTPLPSEPFSHPEDLSIQVEKAIDYHTSLFGNAPKGMWPSEGSVCPEMVEILAGHGIKWIASDEDILFASLRQQRTGSKLYRPYNIGYGSSEVAMFFRDRSMSDNIGFVYAKNSPSQAADNFMYHLRNISRGAKAYDFNPFVAAVLDGENPWEYYPDSGEEFLRALYGALSSSEEIRTSSYSKFLEENTPGEKISNLFTGSWINHNFAIWIGHEEDRKAWEMLARTRRYVESKGNEADPLAWEEISIAEGSDWFWWYGEDFNSGNDEAFDNLFRTHLSNCYRLHGDNPPPELSQSIITHHEVAPVRTPVGFIHPRIDGRVSYYYEWIKSGYYVPSSTATSMYRHHPLITCLYYGLDRENLFMRIDFSSTPKNGKVRVHIVSPEPSILDIPFKEGKMILRLENGLEDTEAQLTSVAYQNIMEFKVPFSILHANPSDRMRFFVTIQEEAIEIERHPSAGVLSFSIPDEKFERIMWHV